MTFISNIQFKDSQYRRVIKPDAKIRYDNISVIIPVKNNQRGVDNLLDSYTALINAQTIPKEIIIVDNNSSPPLRISERHEYINNLIIKKCQRPGPAAARNVGIEQASSKWILFIDSDCQFTETTLAGYYNPADLNCIGYAGKVKALGKSIYSEYYDEHDMLYPRENPLEREKRPQYLITANCLIWKPALVEVKGFDERIKIASGEDVEISYKLSGIGRFAYMPASIVCHDYGDTMYSFLSRFYRYGKIIRNLKRIGVIKSAKLISFDQEKVNNSPIDFMLEIIRNIANICGYIHSIFRPI
ncbi:glycosyltransferase [Fibrella forsythiae]|uniref:Glycosyltransferase n=1 Tax=Fibrella forsythiae TaxID=2817061 RepID=A0ABS3JKS5_9BACT|nr:glycosyltransferase [Fibrella forsythiae]MBO0950595.1 glycosyltransferase [Fibrella forsythiae]